MGKKKIELIRRNISRRRRIHPRKFEEREFTAQVSTEEKHGFMPYIQAPINSTKPSYFKFIFKVLLSVSLFIVVKLAVEPNNFFSDHFKERTIHAFTEDFPFAQAYVWYEKRFGTPLALISDKDKITPVKKEVSDQFVLPVNGQFNSLLDEEVGLSIKPRKSQEVKAMRDGIVLFKGKDKKTNKKTIIIQHEDMTKSHYSNLSSINIHLYEFVHQNQAIGRIDPMELEGDFYFSIEKNRQQIDPLRVINLD